MREADYELLKHIVNILSKDNPHQKKYIHSLIDDVVREKEEEELDAIQSNTNKLKNMEI